jgi:predicted dienelactone hydrolase
MTVDVVDTSRPTAPNRDFPGSPERRMAVEIWYPAASADRDAPADTSGAPYPVIVFAHGYTSSRVQSSTFTHHLASHGYVVASPDFPLTSSRAPGGPAFLDTVNQPGDVSFVLDELERFAADPEHPLAAMVDSEHVGLTGHSGGGFTTLFALYGGDLDSRIDAALPIAATGCFLTDEDVGDVAVPAMFLIGSEDLLIAPSGNRRAYELANAPRYWVELVGGGHVRFADADIDDSIVAGRVRNIVQGEFDRAAPEGAGARFADNFEACASSPEPAGAPLITLARQQELLRTFATPFFDAYLYEDAAAKSFLEGELPAITEGAARYMFETR